MYGRSNVLFMRLVHTEKANLFNLSISNKLIGWSKMNVRIKNGIKVTSYMDLKQRELHYVCNSSIIFVITYNNIYPLYNQQEIIMSEGNDGDDEGMVVIDTKHCTRYTTDIVHPLQYLQVIFVDNKLEVLAKLNRYYKIFNPCLTDLPCVISCYKLKLDCFCNALWLHPGSVDVYSTYVMIPMGNVICNIEIFLKICNTSGIISNISNQNPTFIIRNDNCLQSTASIFTLPNQYLYHFQGYFVEVFMSSQTGTFLKRCSDNKHYLYSHYLNIHSISTVSHNVT